MKSQHKCKSRTKSPCTGSEPADKYKGPRWLEQKDYPCKSLVPVMNVSKYEDEPC